ncbi:MAG: DUF1330 domain-containing protein [Alphaproteobacteria bacterium]
MSAFVILDVDINDMARYQQFMAGVKPALEWAGGKYLARASKHEFHDGDWSRRRKILLEIPLLEAWEFIQGEIARCRM